MLSLAWETFYMSVLVFGIGYWLHYRAFHKNLADENDFVKSDTLKEGIKDKKGRYRTGNPFINKWLEFGGGYYGIVALLKLIFIEFQQLSEFLTDSKAIQEFIENFGIGTLVRLFIEQIMNFVQALIWPVGLLGRLSVFQIAIFIGLTWFAYELSRKFARKKLNGALENA